MSLNHAVSVRVFLIGSVIKEDQVQIGLRLVEFSEIFRETDFKANPDTDGKRIRNCSVDLEFKEEGEPLCPLRGHLP